MGEDSLLDQCGENLRLPLHLPRTGRAQQQRIDVQFASPIGVNNLIRQGKRRMVAEHVGHLMQQNVALMQGNRILFVEDVVLIRSRDPSPKKLGHEFVRHQSDGSALMLFQPGAEGGEGEGGEVILLTNHTESAFHASFDVGNFCPVVLLHGSLSR